MKSRPVLRQQFDSGGDVLLFAVGKPGPPLPELVRVLGIPSHRCMDSCQGFRVLALFTVGDVYASLCNRSAYAPFSVQRRSRALFGL